MFVPFNEAQISDIDNALRIRLTFKFVKALSDVGSNIEYLFSNTSIQQKNHTPLVVKKLGGELGQEGYLP